MGDHAPRAEDVYRYMFRMDRSGELALSDGFSWTILFVKTARRYAKSFWPATERRCVTGPLTVSVLFSFRDWSRTRRGPWPSGRIDKGAAFSRGSYPPQLVGAIRSRATTGNERSGSDSGRTLFAPSIPRM